MQDLSLYPYKFQVFKFTNFITVKMEAQQLPRIHTSEKSYWLLICSERYLNIMLNLVLKARICLVSVLGSSEYRCVEQNKTLILCYLPSIPL